MGFLIFSLIIFFLAVWLAINVVTYALNKNEYTIDEHGQLHSPNEDRKEDDFFTYCFKPALFEAFQVSGEYLPPWAISDRMEVQILPKPQIIIKEDGKEPVIAHETDYVARNALGDIWVISEEDMHDGFIKIKIDQEESA